VAGLPEDEEFTKSTVVDVDIIHHEVEKVNEDEDEEKFKQKQAAELK
jgi:hypothetical protein